MRHRQGPTSRRRWRGRGRRGQVAAVATILGLLLFVTMLANFLATQLPAQMRLNDANHALTVENQLARLSAALHGVAAKGAVGGLLSQPITLGSLGAPPFAGADGASVGPSTVKSQMFVSYTVQTPEVYSPPGGWPAGGNIAKSGCSYSPAGSQNPTNVSCKGAVDLTQNFTNGSHYISVTGAANLHLNFTTSYSTIVIGAAGGLGNTVTVVGNHDTIYLNATGGSGVHIIIYGNYDKLYAFGEGGATVRLYLVGSHDFVSWSANGASSTFVESAWGSYDSTTDDNTNAQVYYTGFNNTRPRSSVCPSGNTSKTDTVTGTGGTVNYNNSVFTGGGSGGGWSRSWHKISVPPGVPCPFFSSHKIKQSNSAGLGGSFLVHLINTYTPPADVAFDQGAVIYAQANGLPLMLVGPTLNYSRGTLTVWVPQFFGKLAQEEGVGTADFSARLASAQTIDLPSFGTTLAPGTSVTVTVISPYVAAWVAYLSAIPSLAALFTCSAPVGSTACTGPYSFGQTAGTVVLTVPATSLALTLATYTIGLY